MLATGEHRRCGDDSGTPRLEERKQFCCFVKRCEFDLLSADSRWSCVQGRAASGSAKSKNSDRSLGRYKKAGGGGADESLFGGQPAAVGSAAPSRKVEQMRKGPPSKVEYDSVVITAQDLARLRIVSDTSGALTTEQRERAAEMEAKAAAQARAKERKDRMVAIEAKRKANAPKSDLELEDEENKAGLLDGAQARGDHVQNPRNTCQRFC